MDVDGASASPEPTPSDPAPRLLWPDVAKGACILLVVLHHVVGKHYLGLVPGSLGGIATGWEHLTNALKPLRMPVFFTVSGYFAAPALVRPWRASSRRVLGSYYLYVVWLLIFFGVYELERTMPANRTDDLPDLAGQLVWASTSMWFLFALAAYFVVAKLLRPLPVWLVLGAAVALSAQLSLLHIDETNRYSVVAYFGYFVFGAYLPDAVRWVAERRLPLWLLVPVFAAWAVVVEQGYLLSSQALLVAGVLGVLLGVTVAVRVAPTRLGAPLAWVGRRTLRIYVLHLVVLAVVVHLPTAIGPEGMPLHAAWVTAYPLVLAALVTTACFAVHAVLLRVGGGALFTMPHAVPWGTATGAVTTTSQENPRGVRGLRLR